MKNLLSGAWWKAAGLRAFRTALVIAVPYAPTVIYDNTWIVVGSTAAFGAVISLLTSLRGIPETSDSTVPWYYAIFERTVKTAAQSLVAAFGSATVFEAVTWSEVPAVVGSAVLGTLFLTVLNKLPGADEPVAAIKLPAKTVTDEGVVVEAEVPVVAVTAAAVSTPAPAEDDSSVG
jgi:hypothetical protein